MTPPIRPGRASALSSAFPARLAWAGSVVLLGVARPAAAPPLPTLPAEVRLALLSGVPADGLEAARARCDRGDFRLEPTPDRFPHAPPEGPHYVDLGFLAEGELDEPFRTVVAARGSSGGRCGVLPGGGGLVLRMATLPPQPWSTAELGAWDARQARRAVAADLRSRAIPEAAAGRGFDGVPRGAPGGGAVTLEGGVAWLGSTAAEVDERVGWYRRYVEAHVGPARRERYEDEVLRPVQVREFALDRTEVTVGRFQAFVDATGYAADPRSVSSGSEETLPVVHVDAADAWAFCTWSGGRLPTADEWEFAARGTESRRFPWGDAPPDGTRANFCDLRCGEPWATPDLDDGASGRAPVGSWPAGATPEGLLDLAGNVREWTATPVDGERLLVKGGGHRNAWDDMVPADVRANRWSERQPDLGFRCAWDPAVPVPGDASGL